MYKQGCNIIHNGISRAVMKHNQVNYQDVSDNLLLQNKFKLQEGIPNNITVFFWTIRESFSVVPNLIAQLSFLLIRENN